MRWYREIIIFLLDIVNEKLLLFYEWRESILIERKEKRTGTKREKNESNEKRGTLLVFSVIRETPRELE